MGGFKPSRADIAGSTIVGSDKDVDVHQFSGSVFISGSLTLNGSSVSGGGGGGAVANYTNSGDNRVITSVDSDTINGEAALTFDGTSLTTTQITASTSVKAAVLQVSSSAEGALFRVDHSTQTGDKPIIFVTGSGLVAIGTDTPRTDSGDTNRLHIMAEAGADQGQNPALNSALVLENNDHVALNIITPAVKSGMIIFGDANASNKAYFYYDHQADRYNINAGFSEYLMTVNAISGHVGIGTENPNNPIEVIATASQQRWSYDTGVNNFATMAVSSDGDMTLSGSNYATGTFAAGDIHIDASGRINLQADAGSFQFQRPGNTNRFTIDTSQGEVYLTNIQNTNTIFRGLTNQTTQLTIDPLNTRVLLPTTHSMAFRDAATTINSIAVNNLRITAPGTVGISNDLEITGSLTLGGTEITSTAAELNLLDAGATQHTASVLAAIPKLAKATYDFAEFGGGQSTFTLTGVTIPDNAMIVGGWVDTETNPASGGAATIAFGMTLGAVTDLFLGATAFDQFDSQAGGQLTAVNQATPAQYMKMAGSSTITCTIGGANLTAGKLHIYLQYVVGA